VSCVLWLRSPVDTNSSHPPIATAETCGQSAARVTGSRAAAVRLSRPPFSTRLLDSARGVLLEYPPAGIEAAQRCADRRGDGHFEDLVLDVPGGSEAADVGIGDLV
jgi:hypothetical protein